MLDQAQPLEVQPAKLKSYNLSAGRQNGQADGRICRVDSVQPARRWAARTATLHSVHLLNLLEGSAPVGAASCKSLVY